MDYDLEVRAKRIEREAEKRKAAARREKEKERQAEQRARRREQELERQARRARREREEQQARLEQEEIARRQRTGGVNFRKRLKPVRVDAEGDKIRLPASCLAPEIGLVRTLSDGTGGSSSATLTGAPQRAMHFELSLDMPAATAAEAAGLAPAAAAVQDGGDAKRRRVTHCGVLEFTAEEGEVLIPEKVARCLLELRHPHAEAVKPAADGDDDEDADASANASSLVDQLGMVTVEYVVLPCGTYAQLQPVSHGFYAHVHAVKRALEDNLRFQTALTEGDIVTVWHRGKKYDMRVVKLQPEFAVSLVDTELEVDLQESEEYLQHVRDQADKGSASASSSSSSATATATATTAAIAGAGPGRTVGTSAGWTAAAAPPLPPQTAAAAAASATAPAAVTEAWAEVQPLPDAVAVDSRRAGGVIRCQIRIPGGGPALSRSFHWSDPVRSLFDFVAMEAGRATTSFRLVTRFPRRVLELRALLDGGEAPSPTFEDADLAERQESLFLEDLSP